MGLKSFLKSPRQWIREKAAQAVRNNSYGWSWFYIRILRVNPIEAVKEICKATNAAVAWIVLGVKKMFSGPQSGFKIDMETTTRAISKMLENPEVSNFAIRLKEIVECMPLSIYERPESDQILRDLARSFDYDRMEAVLEEAKRLPEYDNKGEENIVRTIFDAILVTTIKNSKDERFCDFMRVPGLIGYLLDKGLASNENLSDSIERADADQLCRAIVAAGVADDTRASELIANDIERRLSQSQRSGDGDKIMTTLLQGYTKSFAAAALIAKILHRLAGGPNGSVREGILQHIEKFFVKELNKNSLDENVLKVLDVLTATYKMEFSTKLNRLALEKIIENRLPMIKKLSLKYPEYVLSYASVLCDKEFSYATYLLENAVDALQFSNFVKNGNFLKLARDILTKIANKCPETLYDVNKYYGSWQSVLLLLENENVMSSEEYHTLITEPMKHHRDSVLRLFSLVSFGSDIAKTHPRLANMAADFTFTKGNVTKELRSNAIQYFIMQYDNSRFAKSFIDSALKGDNIVWDEIIEELTKLPACYTYKEELLARLKRVQKCNEEEQSVAPIVVQDSVQPGHGF